MSFVPGDATEAEDVASLVRLCRSVADPWHRSLPLHLTASALVVDPGRRRYLLRWHSRQERWLQVGGHADAGESEPEVIALREACEETGLSDLQLVGGLVQVAIVEVAPGRGEPAHSHGDLRYVLTTANADAATPEGPGTPLKWLSFGQVLSDLRGPQELGEPRELCESHELGEPRELCESHKLCESRELCESHKLCESHEPYDPQIEVLVERARLLLPSVP